MAPTKYRDPFKTTIKRGSTAVLTAMQNGDHRKFAVVESIVGERPHAVLIAATNETPALLASLLRLAKRHFPHKTRAALAKARGKES